jgi:chaperonin GroES
MKAAKKAAFTVQDKRPNYQPSIALGKAEKEQPVPVCPKVKSVPLGSKVLVWRIPEVEGVIKQADIAVEKPLECQVVAVSTSGLSEYDTQALAQIKTGDKVLIRKNSGTEIKVEGQELTVLHVMDILLKL